MFSLIGWLVVLYIIAFWVYERFLKKVDPHVEAHTMPKLQPLPIPTKNHEGNLRKAMAGLFEVRQWKLEDNWEYKIDDETTVVIPKGFIFDGASIPRPLWSLINPTGLLLIPGLIHDYGYKYDMIWKKGEKGKIEPCYEGAGKDHWDKLFRDVGDEVNGFALVNKIGWLGVRLGGGGPWKKHRNANNEPSKPEAMGTA